MKRGAATAAFQIEGANLQVCCFKISLHACVTLFYHVVVHIGGKNAKYMG